MRVPGAKAPVLATDELIVGVSERGKDAVEAMAARIGARVAVANPFIKGQWVLRLERDAPTDSIEISRRLAEEKIVEYAYPNFINVFEDDELVPNDTRFGDQWHLRNTGQAAGTTTADSRASLAWDFTLGNGTNIAVIENGGFQSAHPDLSPNLWTNPGDVADGVDNDGNLCVDDVSGCNFGPKP